MSYSVMTLDRRVQGHWPMLLQAWDRARDLLRAGQPRVAIVDARTHEVLMVLERPVKATVAA